MTIPRVTKFSTHEIFHPRIFSRLLHIGLRESRNLKPRKLILKTRNSFHENLHPRKLPAIRYTQVKDYTIFMKYNAKSVHIVNRQIATWHNTMQCRNRFNIFLHSFISHNQSGCRKKTREYTGSSVEFTMFVFLYFTQVAYQRGRKRGGRGGGCPPTF